MEPGAGSKEPGPDLKVVMPVCDICRGRMAKEFMVVRSLADAKHVGKAFVCSRCFEMTSAQGERRNVTVESVSQQEWNETVAGGEPGSSGEGAPL